MPSLLIWRDWILVRFWELILEVCILLWLFLISFLEKTYVPYVFRGKRLTQTLHLMFFCPYVLLFPALAAAAPRYGASPSVLRVSGLSPNSWKTCSTAQTCKISTPKLGIYTSKPYICPVGHKNSRPSAHRQSALLPASGHKRSCPPPESAKLRDFFCTPQRAGIQRVTPVSREIPENFSKISSPKIWCVCQKSVPLHSQIRNEAYNISQIWSNSIFENIT